MDGVLFFAMLLCGLLAAVVYFSQRREYRTLEKYCSHVEQAYDEQYLRIGARQAISELLDSTKTVLARGMRRRYAYRDYEIAPGYVYLMGMNDEYYKIGYAGNVKSRLSSVQMSSPYKVTLLHVVATRHAPRLEIILQNQYAEKWAGGEWFKLTPEDVTTICSIQSPVTISDIDQMEQP